MEEKNKIIIVGGLDCRCQVLLNKAKEYQNVIVINTDDEDVIKERSININAPLDLVPKEILVEPDPNRKRRKRKRRRPKKYW